MGEALLLINNAFFFLLHSFTEAYNMDTEGRTVGAGYSCCALRFAVSRSHKAYVL